MIPVVTWGGYLTMGYFPNSTTSTKSSSFKFVCRFWAWLLVVVPPTHWRWSKVSEMNCDKPARWRTNNSAKQRNAKKSWVGGNLHLIAARNTAKWWWLSSAAKFPPFRPLFAAIRSTLILTLPPACVPVCLWDQTTEREWYDFTLFLFLAQNLIHCFSVFSDLFWRRSISPSPSSRAPPHQKFPFPSENGNFTIFAAYQSNSRGGEMEMWK